MQKEGNLLIAERYVVIVVHAFIWRFPNSRGTTLGVSIIRSRVFGGLYWGPLTAGKLPSELKTVNPNRYPCPLTTMEILSVAHIV